MIDLTMHIFYASSVESVIALARGETCPSNFIGIFANRAGERVQKRFKAPNANAVLKFMGENGWTTIDIKIEDEWQEYIPNVSVPNNYLGDQIKRYNRNIFITSLITVVISVWILFSYGQLDYFSIFLIGLAVCGIWNLVKVWKYKRSPLRHPIMSSLAKFGPAEKIAETIIQDVKNSRYSAAGIFVTKSWLLKPSLFGLEIILLDEIVWVYKKASKNLIYFVPPNNNSGVAIFKRDGSTLKVSCEEHEANRLIQGITGNAPWIVVGLNDELQKLWCAKKELFIAFVDKKKALMHPFFQAAN